MVGGLSKELVDSLNGPGINQLGNVLTVNSEDRDSIDMLWLWLEKLEVCSLKVLEMRLNFFQPGPRQYLQNMLRKRESCTQA
jgi:hypothetical protein